MKFIPIVYCVSGLFFQWGYPPTVHAQEVSGEIPFEVIAIDALGDITDFKTSLEQEWSWPDPRNRPTFQVYIHLPEGFKIQGTINNPKYRIKEVSESPFSNPAGKVLQVTWKDIGIANFNVTGEGGETRSIVLQPKPDLPVSVVHPSCEEFDIELVENELDDTSSFTALGCHQNDAKTHLLAYLYNDKSSKIRTPTEVQAKHAVGRSQIRFGLPKKEQDAFAAKADFFQSKKGVPASSHYTVLVGGGTRPSGRLSVLAGLGPSLLLYEETSSSLDVEKTIVAFTPKIGATYQLYPKILDIGANFFMNVVSFSLDSSDQPSANWWGANARARYQLPVDWLDNTWYASLGFYFWGMSVTGDAYGIKAMLGPQAFVMTRGKLKKAPYYVYFKYAFLNEVLSISFNNNEVALGMGYGVPKLFGIRRPWFLTLDIASVSFESEIVTNKMSLLSFSLGLATPIWPWK